MPHIGGAPHVIRSEADRQLNIGKGYYTEDTLPEMNAPMSGVPRQVTTDELYSVFPDMAYEDFVQSHGHAANYNPFSRQYYDSDSGNVYRIDEAGDVTTEIIQRRSPDGGFVNVGAQIDEQGDVVPDIPDGQQQVTRTVVGTDEFGQDRIENRVYIHIDGGWHYQGVPGSAGWTDTNTMLGNYYDQKAQVEILANPSDMSLGTDSGVNAITPWNYSNIQNLGYDSNTVNPYSDMYNMSIDAGNVYMDQLANAYMRLIS